MRFPHLITAMLLSTAAWAQLPFSFSGSAGGDCAPQMHSEPWPGTTVPANAIRFDWSATNATANPIPMQVRVFRNTYAIGGGGFVSEQELYSFTITAAPTTTTTGADFWPCASTQFQGSLAHSVRVTGPNGTCTAFSMTVSLGTPAFANDAEGNNSFGTGPVTTLNTDYDGHLRFNGTTDDDWYRIQLPAQGKMVITLQSETPGSTASPIEAYLWYTNGTFINQWNGSTGTNQVPNTNVFEQTCVGGTGGGQYYLRLHPVGGCDISYRLTISLVSPAFATDPHPNSTPGTPVAHNTYQDGQIKFDFQSNTYDYFNLVPPYNGVMNFEVQAEHAGPVASTMTVTLLTTAGTTIQTWTVPSGANGVPITSTMSITCRSSTTDYDLRFSSAACGASYRFKYVMTPAVYANDLEPNGNAGGSTEAHDTWYEGQIGFDNQTDDDYFNLVPPFNGVMNIEILAEHADAAAGTVSVTLLTTAGTTIQTWSIPAGANGAPQSTIVSVPCRSSTTDYDLRFSDVTCGVSYRWKYWITPAVFANDLEPNSSAGGSTEAHDTWYEGQIGFDNQTDDDVYNLVPPFNGVMNIEIMAEHADVAAGTVSVSLLTSTGLTIQAWSIPAGANGAPQSTIVTVPCRGSTTDYDLRFSDVTCGVSYRWKYWITPAVFANDVEPNNGTGPAIILPEGQTAEGQLDFDAGDNTDYYRANLSSDGVMHVNIEAEHADVSTTGIITVNLYVSSGSLLQSWTAPVGANSLAVSTPLSITCRGNSGNYYLRVSSSVCGSSYRISYSVTPPFFAQDAEPNSGTSQAIVLAETQTAQGHLNFYFGDNNDEYRANLSGDGVMNVTIEAEHADVSTTGLITVELYISNGSVLQTWTAPVGASSVAMSTSLSKTCRGNGLPYYLRVSSDICGTTYRISYSVTPPVYANDPEPNNSSPGTPMDLNAANQLGHIGFYNTTDDDYYAFTHPGGPWSITVSAEHAGTGAGTMGMVVINNPGTVFGTFTVPAGGSSTAVTNTFTIPSLPAGSIYRVRLSDVTCGVTYRLHCYDTDGDGTCNAFDLCAGGPEPNTPCNDNNACTANDVITSGCACAGTPTADTDGDGTCDASDGCPADPLKIAAGICGCGVADTDSDGDGTANCIDGCPADPLKIAAGICGCGVADTDSDGDGTANCIDGCPADPLKIAAGTCGCGVADTDSDGDGNANCIDGCPADPLKIAAGICGCGVADTDSDGDGTANCIDGCPADPLKIAAGTCGCGVAETDSDGDGTANCNDGCPADPLKSAAGICGCGVADTDSDGDGTANCNDGCPADPLKIAAGICGCGVTDADGDGDGTVNCNDGCPNDPLKVSPGTCGCSNLEPGSACNDNNGNTSNDVIGANCLCAGTPTTGCTNDLELVFQTDGTSIIVWELREQGTSALMQSGGGQYPASPNYALSTCLPNGNYYLVVSDNGCNGITNGGYFLRTVGGTMLIDDRNSFLSGCTSQIAGGEGFTLPVGTDRLLSTSCDKLDWRNSEYIVASDNAAVTAVWNNFPAGSTQRATSGYEMWWYNPNGGYTFRRFQSHATTNGMTANAVRACHFKINSWSGNQLQDGVLYNVKVRSRVIGANAAWGPACRFVLDPVRAQCPLTHLLDVPGNQYLSCGATRAIGSGAANLVHARVATRVINNVSSNANKYQFRFITDAGGSTVIKTSSTGQYWVNTMGLAPCKTYEVEVRASFDHGTSYCNTYAASNPYAPKWGRVCTLNTSGCPSGNGGGQNMAVDGSSFGSAQDGSPRQLVLYPNPNQGDQLFLRIDQIEQGVGTVSVDIHDTFGKRVSASVIPVGDGLVNTVIDLKGELAAGMYLVNITMGDVVHTERLVIAAE